MSNTVKIINDLINAVNNNELKKAFIITQVLEDILRSNIYKDEENAENNKELQFLNINENIKKEVVQALLVINKDVGGVKVYLDDKRPTPNGYVRAFWPEDVQLFIESLNVTELSLDHDLGNDEHGTGNDVVCYVEEKVYFTDYIAPKISVHSDNSSAKAKMMLGINNIINKQKER